MANADIEQEDDLIEQEFSKAFNAPDETKGDALKDVDNDVENEDSDDSKTKPEQEVKDIDDTSDDSDEDKDEDKDDKNLEDEIIDLNPEAAKTSKPEDTEKDKIIETLTKELESVKSAPKFASPEIEKINEYVKNGGKISREFWELQTKDYVNVDVKDTNTALSVLKDKMRYDEGLDDSIIDKIIRKEYPILSGKTEEGEYDDDEKDDELITLMRNAKNALPVLKELQDKAKLPDVGQDRQKEIERVNNLYRAQSRERMKNYQGLTIELSDQLRVKSSPSEETLKYINSVVTEPTNQGDAWFKQRYVKDGKIDFEKFASEMQFLEEKDAILRKVFNQGLKRGEKETINRELRQASTDVETSQRSAKASKDGWIKEAAKVLEGNMNPLNFEQ